jgi:hypothetical protein
MAADDGHRETPVTAKGIEHVCLSYHYRDHDDIDGYLSLLDADVQLILPSEQEIRGREQVAEFRARLGQEAGTHLIHEVIGSGDLVIATGCYFSRGSGKGIDFTELFRLSRDGLLRSQKRYYFLDPRFPAAQHYDKPGAGS